MTNDALPAGIPDQTDVAKVPQGSLDRRLSAYALAAAAAMLGPTQAGAEVIYTPANVTITRGTLSIDLNADGLKDFILVDDYYVESHTGFRIAGRRLVVGGSASAGVIPFKHEAQVLVSGAAIGPSQKFRDVHDPRLVMAGAQSFYGGSTGTCCVEFYGNWESIKNQYLGLKFQIDGETHYGWARVSVKSFVFRVANTAPARAATVPAIIASR